MLDAVADAVNPLLAIAALVIIFGEWRRSWKSGVACVIAAGLGLAGIYAVAAIDVAFQVWPRFGGDYSLHAAFAVSVAMSVAIWRRHWLGWMLAVVGAYLVLIVALRYHSIADVLTASVVAFIVTALGHVVAQRIMNAASADATGASRRTSRRCSAAR